MSKSHYQAGEIAPCPHCKVVARMEAVLFEAPIIVRKENMWEDPNAARWGDHSTARVDSVTSRVETVTGEVGRLVISGEFRATTLFLSQCSSCKKFIVVMARPSAQALTLWPLAADRSVPKEVPATIAGDYNEAALVLGLSAKASAALSRRCLQAVLREQGFQQKDLWEQIAEARKALPSFLQDSLDHIRHFGNFAAHPSVERATGEIIEVEPGEAEWTLEVLDLLFDHYYVQPMRARQRKDALNAKLVAAGKKGLN